MIRSLACSSFSWRRLNMKQQDSIGIGGLQKSRQITALSSQSTRFLQQFLESVCNANFLSPFAIGHQFATAIATIATRHHGARQAHSQSTTWVQLCFSIAADSPPANISTGWETSDPSFLVHFSGIWNHANRNNRDREGLYIQVWVCWGGTALPRIIMNCSCW